MTKREPVVKKEPNEKPVVKKELAVQAIVVLSDADKQSIQECKKDIRKANQKLYEANRKNT